MPGSDFDELAFFRAIHESGVRDEHIDVLVSRSVTTVDGVVVTFEDVWTQRKAVTLEPGIDVQLPAIDDLILTKRFADRPKDLKDIRLLRMLKSEDRT